MAGSRGAGSSSGAAAGFEISNDSSDLAGLSAEISFSSGSISISGELSANDVPVAAKPAARSKSTSRTAPAAATPESLSTSIEFSEEDDKDLSAEDIDHMMSVGTSKTGWQPPGGGRAVGASGIAGGSSSSGGRAARLASAAAPFAAAAPAARRQPTAEVSSDISLSASSGSELSRELDEAAEATQDLYAQLGGRAVRLGGSDSGGRSSSGTGSEGGGAAVPAELAAELQDAAAATNALFDSLQPIRPPSDPGSDHELRDGSEVEDAMAATEALYGMLGHVKAGRGSSSSGGSGSHSRSDSGSGSGASSGAMRSTVRYMPAPLGMDDAAQATEALHSMLATVRDGSPSSSAPSSPRAPALADPKASAEMQEAAAATDALFAQLSFYQGDRRSGSESSKEDRGASDDSHDGGYYRPLAPIWRVKGDSQDLGASDLRESDEDTDSGTRGAPRASVTADEDVVFLKHPSVLPHFPGRSESMTKVLGPKPGMADQATQIGTMNEMSCQVGFDERYRLLFDGCTLPKDAHTDLQPPTVQYIPAPVPGGWVPWGAPEPQPAAAPVIAQQSTTAAEAATPAPPVPPSPDASTVDDYSMSFEEEETTVIGFGGAKIRRTTRGYSSVSQSFVSESIGTGSRSRSRLESPRRGGSVMEPIPSELDETVASMDSTAHSDSSAQPARKPAARAAPAPQPAPRRASTPPAPQPEASPSVTNIQPRTTAQTRPQPAASPHAHAGVVMIPAGGMYMQYPVATMPAAMMAPQQQHAAMYPFAGSAAGLPAGLYGAPTQSALAGAAMVANSMSLMRPSFVPSSIEDAVTAVNGEELFRHQLGTLSQKLARARVGHVESVGRLSAHAAAAKYPVAGGYSYTTLESTLAYIRSNAPYQDC